MKRKFLLVAMVLQQQLGLRTLKTKLLFLLVLLTALSVSGSPRKGVQKNRWASHKHKKALAANPTLSYNSPNKFYVGKSISPLAPTSTGVGTLGYNGPVFIGQNTLNYFQGLAVDVQGNVYVSNDQNGSYAIIKIPVGDGPISTIVSGLSGSGPLTVDASGNIFAVDNQTLIEIPAGTNNINTIGALGNFSSPSGIVVDASDDVFIGDRGSGTQIKEFIGGVGPFINIGSGFNEPYGVALDPSGNVYVLDYGNKAIKMIPAGNGPVQTLASYYYPVAITRDNSGNFFVAGAGAAYNTVTEYPNGNFNNPIAFQTGTYNESTLATDSHGNLYLPGKGGIEEIAEGSGNRTILAAGLNNCEQVAVDAAGNVFVADAYDESVREIPAAGSTYPLTLTPDFDFSGPYGIAVDAADNVYVGDSGTGVIYKIAPGAATPTVIASGVSNVLCIAVDATGDVFACTANANLYKIAAGSNTATVINSGFNQLSSIALDATGNVYGYDEITDDVYKVPNGGAGTPVVLATGLNRAKYLAVDAANNVYITVEGNGSPSEIDQISAAGGNVTTVATTLTQGVPSGIAIDNTGNLYAADYNTTNGFVVDKFTPSGGYYLNTALPAGLTFDNTTGIISGTPTVLTPAANYTVTAYNSSGGSSATVTISVIDDSANLSGLKLSSGSLSPAFAAGTTAYNAALGNGMTSIMVTPTASSSGATIMVNGVLVSSGAPSGAIPLNVGANPITVTVTAPDNITTNTYTIIVTRAPSSVAALANLSISRGALSPTFATGTTSYTDAVGNNVTALTVKPTAAGSGATITVNGTTVTSGTTSQSIPIAEGSNTISIVITAQDGVTMQTYTIAVNRAPSSVAVLAGLSISNGTLSPTFSTLTTSYSVSEATTVSAVTVKPTAAGPGATIKVNGTSVTSGTLSQSITLAPGPNTINIVVTAEDGVTTQTYTVTVTQVLSNDDKLSMLSISIGTLSPAFAANSTAYTVAEDSYVTSVTVKPKVAGIGATLTVNGTTVASGTASQSIPLIVGPNTITIVVTAQDGVTKQTYTLTVTRAASNNAGLANLGVISGTLSPAFSTPVTSYTVAEDQSVTSVKVKPTAAATGATIKVNGVATASGSVSASIPLVVGPNTINIEVTAPDGITTETYIVTVTRAASSVAALAGLSTSIGALSPVFSTPVTSYTVSVDNTVTSVTVRPTVAGIGATVTVDGMAVTSGTSSQSIPLAVGANTISIVVTAQDGVTTDTYTVTVTQAPPGMDGYNPGVSVTKPSETLTIAEDGIKVHQGVTPNGDGVEDFLLIDNITNYPDNRLTIMNRNGQLIFEAKAYDNTSRVFDGHSNKNGQMQLPGTYYYALDYTVNGIIKHKTGFIVLKY